MNFLKTLPQEYVLEEYRIVVFHGSPWNRLDEYIYPTDSLDKFKELPYNFILLGHTHYPMYRKINARHIINPGSCGQPRDCNKPSYATLDVEARKVNFNRVEYDVDALIKDVIGRSETNKYLVDVLRR